MADLTKPIPNKQKLRATEMFRIARMKPVIKPTRPHSHPYYYELILLTDGAGKHRIELEEYEVQPGMVFWLNPGQVHCWDFSRIPEGYVLMFRQECLQDHPFFREKGLQWLNQLPSMLLLSPQPRLWLERLMQTSMELPPHAYAQQAAYLVLMLQHLEALIPTVALEPSGPQKALLIQFQALIDRHFRQRWHVVTYCQHLAVSEKKLNQVCKDLSGRTAGDHLRERLLLEAKRLLMHTALTVSEVAYELGFHDPSHFIKFFKKQTNLTPGEFQQKRLAQASMASGNP